MNNAYLSGASVNAPIAPTNPSIGYPSSGDLAQGVPPTRPGAWWYHMITQELLKVITEAGITPDHADTTQLYQAIQQMAGGGEQARSWQITKMGQLAKAFVSHVFDDAGNLYLLTSEASRGAGLRGVTTLIKITPAGIRTVLTTTTPSVTVGATAFANGNGIFFLSPTEITFFVQYPEVNGGLSLPEIYVSRYNIATGVFTAQVSYEVMDFGYRKMATAQADDAVYLISLGDYPSVVRKFMGASSQSIAAWSEGEEPAFIDLDICTGGNLIVPTVYVVGCYPLTPGGLAVYSPNASAVMTSRANHTGNYLCVGARRGAFGAVYIAAITNPTDPVNRELVVFQFENNQITEQARISASYATTLTCQKRGLFLIAVGNSFGGVDVYNYDTTEGLVLLGQDALRDVASTINCISVAANAPGVSLIISSSQAGKLDTEMRQVEFKAAL